VITKYTEFNIICDNCQVDACNTPAEAWGTADIIDKFGWHFTLPSSHKGKADIKRIAKEYGWKITRNQHLCPRCASQIKDNSNDNTGRKP